MNQDEIEDLVLENNKILKGMRRQQRAIVWGKILFIVILLGAVLFVYTVYGDDIQNIISMATTNFENLYQNLSELVENLSETYRSASELF